jgi:two-component system, OmpR family, sensor kinase
VTPVSEHLSAGRDGAGRAALSRREAFSVRSPAAKGDAVGGRGLRRSLWPRSLRWRLQAWLAVLLTTLLVAFIGVADELQRTARLRQIDAGLETRLATLSGAMREVYRDPPPRRGPPPPRGRRPVHESGDAADHLQPPRMPPGPPPRDRPPEHRPPLGPVSERGRRTFDPSSDIAGLFGPGGEGYYFVVWYRDGTIVGRSANAPAEVLWPARADRDTLPHFRSRGALRETVHCSGLGECVLVGRSVAGDLSALRAFRLLLAGSGGLVLVLGLGVGWWITTRAIRPIEVISAAAVRVSTGNLSGRIRIADPDTELGRLARVLNSTFARLQSAFARQEQFTADAAHELRTPLTILITEAQTTLSRERSAREYKGALETSLAAAQQMRGLTETLLTLARVDTGEDTLPRGPVDLSTVAAACVERLTPLAAGRHVTVRNTTVPLQAFVNAGRIEQTLVNLVSNAIYYNRPGGTVDIGCSEDDEHVVIRVADTGIGISSDDLPRIFDRFYRADPSRSRAEGRSGLGLAICKAIIEAEHGLIGAESTLGVGTTFTVRLPRDRAHACAPSTM